MCDYIIKTNANWDFVEQKILYINYLLDNRYEPKQEWVDYFEYKLLTEAGQLDTPLIISEAWLFNWNGTQCAVVNFSNVVLSDKPFNVTKCLPSGKKHIIYKMSAIFLDGQPPMPLGELFLDEVLSTPIGEKTSISFSGRDANDSASFYSLQCSQNGNFAAFPIYTDHGGGLLTQGFHYRSAFLIADIDGDQNSELVFKYCFAFSSLTHQITVFKFEDKKIERVFNGRSF